VASNPCCCCCIAKHSVAAQLLQQRILCVYSEAAYPQPSLFQNSFLHNCEWSFNDCLAFCPQSVNSLPACLPRFYRQRLPRQRPSPRWSLSGRPLLAPALARAGRGGRQKPPPTPARRRRAGPRPCRWGPWTRAAARWRPSPAAGRLGARAAAGRARTRASPCLQRPSHGNGWRHGRAMGVKPALCLRCATVHTAARLKVLCIAQRKETMAQCHCEAAMLLDHSVCHLGATEGRLGLQSSSRAASQRASHPLRCGAMSGEKQGSVQI
jgi:hypothetical protein